MRRGSLLSWTSRKQRPLTRGHLRFMRIFFTLVTAIIVGVGGFFVVQGTLYWMAAAASTAWPVVQGTVTHSEVTKHSSTHKGHRRTTWGARIEFDYAVGGATHHGTLRTFKTVAASEASSHAAVAQHPVGATVAVSVDPLDPSRAVLDPGWDWSNAIPVGTGLFAMVFAGFVLVLARRVTRKGEQMLALVASNETAAEKTDETTDGTTDGNAVAPQQAIPAFHNDLPSDR